MHKPVLKAIASQRTLRKLEGEDVKHDKQGESVQTVLTKLEGYLKSNEHSEITNMQWVYRNRDFQKIKDTDLEAVFRNLNARCPETWTNAFETRAKELHQKFMLLKNGSTSMFIDPERKPVESKSDETAVQRLMISPGIWSMETKERAFEFSEILRHFTLYAPFEGRPFIRAWLEALMPCFSRWILLSNSAESEVTITLKHFLGAFGQPGIVVCLEDKGAAMLKILKNSARAVEALGRGNVELHYWKRLTESSCGGDPDWRRLASIKSEPLLLSQLDYVPHDWLLDSSDWPQVFANIVSPEISKRFERKIVDTLNDNMRWIVMAGPPKTLARCQAKGMEYMSEFNEEQELPRWGNFAKKFEKVFQRAPSKPEDFVWNVVDFARCSITVPDAGDIMEVKHLIEKQFPVVCVKNGYHSEVRVKGSGYRDLKLLVEVEFNDLVLDGVTRANPKTTLICEIQILCQAWLENKKTTSMSYKILRAKCLRDLLNDAAKYVRNSDVSRSYKDEIEIIKNGWANLAKATDFTIVDADQLLKSACREGWSAAGVSMLVKDFEANIECINVNGSTPLIIASCWGRDDIVKLLIQLGGNIEHREQYGSTALAWAAQAGQEGCVRILLSAGARVDVKDSAGDTPFDNALFKFRKQGTSNYNRIMKLLKGETVRLSGETGKTHSTMDELVKAAAEGSLTQFLDL